MKRRKDPGPAPFLDQFGRPAWTNPLDRYRPNPEFTGDPSEVAPPRRGELSAPDSRLPGWPRRIEVADLPTPAVEQTLPPAPKAASVPPLDPEKAQRIAELMQLLGDADLAPPPPAIVDAPESAPTKTRAERLSERRVRPSAQPIERDASTVQTRAQREAERRASARLRARRAGSIAVAGAAVFGVTAAYGFWTGGADAGSRIPKPRMQKVAAEATAGMPSSPLVPGGKGNVKLRVDNPNPFVVTLTGVEGGPFPSAVNGVAGCTISNSGVTFTAPAVLDVDIPAKSTALVRLVDAAAMGPGAAPGCRGHTFTIPVSITVRRALPPH